MSPNEVRVQHMIDAARSAMRFVEGLDEVAFDRDERTWRAVVNCIEVIGKAAGRVDEATRAGCPGIPWPQVIGMRNRLIHGYFELDLRLVYAVANGFLPPLVEELTAWQARQPEPPADN